MRLSLSRAFTPAVLMLALVSGPAVAVTIDFEEFPTGQTAGPPLSSQGFVFEAISVYGWIPTGGYVIQNGLDGNLFNYCPDCQLTITESTGQAFSLESADLGLSVLGSPIDLTIVGYYSGGGSISTTFTATETTFQNDPLTPFFFGAGWTNLSSVVFETTAHSGGVLTVPNSLVDNIVVIAVPVPAAVWLFGSALAGLGWLRRKPN